MNELAMRFQDVEDLLDQFAIFLRRETSEPLTTSERFGCVDRTGDVVLVQERLDAMIDEWQGEFVYRKEIKEFSQGCFSYQQLAQADLAGRGPEGAYKRGNQTFYHVSDLTDWMKSYAQSPRKNGYVWAQ